ncbi:MAG: PHP domain-containing protein [Hungatella sp.]
MGYIDLHVHSSASDGTLSPGDVLRRAAARQLDAIALTDHDTTDGLADAMKAVCELQESGAYTPELIPGIEMSCVYLGTEIHILGFYVDPGRPYTGTWTEGYPSGTYQAEPYHAGTFSRRWIFYYL